MAWINPYRIRNTKDLTSISENNVVYKYFDINKASVAVVHPSSSNIQQVSQNHENAKSISFKGVVFL